MPKGKKKCPKCKELISARAKTCECGHTFEKGSDIKNIYEGLLKSGMNEEKIFKILGSNWLEFMKLHF